MIAGNIPFLEYLAMPDRVNWSTLKYMRRSALAYQHALGHERKDTAGLLIGRASHTATFEGDRFLLEYACFKGAIRRGKDWDAFKAQHEGQSILKIEEYQRCLKIRDAVRANKHAMKYLAHGKGEQTITWTDPHTGLDCKGRVDWISSSSPAIVDLKTTGDIDPIKFANLSARMAYHVQSAFYRDGYAYGGGEILPSVLIVVEKDPPFDVAVFVLDEEALFQGTGEYQQLLARVNACRALNKWPGRYDEEQPLGLPAWAMDETEDEGMTAEIVSGEEETNARL